MEIIFETLEPNLVGLLEYGVKSDPTWVSLYSNKRSKETLMLFRYSQAVSMMGAVESQQEKWDGSDQEFALRLCKSILQRLIKMFETFIVSKTILHLTSN